LALNRKKCDRTFFQFISFFDFNRHNHFQLIDVLNYLNLNNTNVIFTKDENNMESFVAVYLAVFFEQR